MHFVLSQRQISHSAAWPTLNGRTNDDVSEGMDADGVEERLSGWMDEWKNEIRTAWTGMEPTATSVNQ